MLLNAGLIGASAGGGTWTPADMTTELWLDGADSSTITLDGSNNIEQWNDKSGNSRHATQTSSSARPSIGAGVLNGLDVINFSGSPRFLNVATGLPSEATLMIVAQANGNTQSFAQTDQLGGPAANKWAFYRNGSELLTFRLNLVSDTISSSITGANILEMWGASGGNVSVAVNGAGISSGTPGTWDSTNMRLARDAHMTARFLSGFIAEIVMLDLVATTDTRQRIEGYLAHKWGLTANLPSDHPYRTVAP